MFSRNEQAALREMIAERERLRVLVADLERRVEMLELSVPLKKLAGTKREAASVRQ